MIQHVPYTRRAAEQQRNNNIAKSGTTAKTTDMDRLREERQARRARLKAKHRGTNTTDRCITVKPSKVQPRSPKRRAKQRDGNTAGSSKTVVPENEPPRSPEQQAEQRNDNDPNFITTSIKMFYELPPPGQDEPKTWAWQLRMLVRRQLTLSRTEYCKIDWKSEFDFQKFQRECVEHHPCYVHYYRGKNPVPFACLKHSQGTNAMWRQKDEEFREQWHARIATEKKEREAAREEDEKRIERDIAEHPDLWLRGKLWEPVGPGIALISGSLLKSVATFFCDCDITVEEATFWNSDRRYQKKGGDIVAQLQSGNDEITWSTEWRAQVRISIDKFRQPGHMRDLEHPGHAAVRNPQGRHGNALCAVIFFLGMTGPEKTDKNCSYWFYSASGFSGPDLSKIGQNGPFRMVRLSNVSNRDHNGFMMCFDLRTGKKRAKAFSDGFNSKVKRMGVFSVRWDDFHHWHDLPEEPEGFIEDDDPGEGDSGEEDPGEDNPVVYDIIEDDTVEDDLFGDDLFEDDLFEDDLFEDDLFEDDLFEDDPAEDDPAEDDPAGNDSGGDEEHEDAQDSGSDTIFGIKRSIPKHLRGGAKV